MRRNALLAQLTFSLLFSALAPFFGGEEGCVIWSRV